MSFSLQWRQNIPNINPVTNKQYSYLTKSAQAGKSVLAVLKWLLGAQVKCLLFTVWQKLFYWLKKTGAEKNGPIVAPAGEPACSVLGYPIFLGVILALHINC